MNKGRKITVESLKKQMVDYEDKLEKIKERIKVAELEEKLSNYTVLENILQQKNISFDEFIRKYKVDTLK